VTTQRSSIRQRKKHAANSREKEEEHSPVPILLLLHTKKLFSQLKTTDTTQTICGMQIAQKLTGKKKKNSIRIKSNFFLLQRRHPRKEHQNTQHSHQSTQPVNAQFLITRSITIRGSRKD